MTRPGRRGRADTAGWSVAVVLLVIAASAVVALGVGGVGLRAAPAELGDGSAGRLRLAGAALALAGLVGLLIQRARLRTDRARDPDPSGAGLLTAAKIMGVLALVALLLPAPRVESDAGPVAAGAVAVASTDGEAPSRSEPAPVVPDLPPPPADESGEPDEPEDPDELEVADPDRPFARPSDQDATPADDAGFDWSTVQRGGTILLIALLVVFAVAAILGLTGRLGRRRTAPPADEPADASAGESLVPRKGPETVPDSSDPRSRVIAAYHELLVALTAAGAPRRSHEAPHEHLERALRRLSMRSEPMRELAQLSIAAQFGRRPVTHEQAAAAREAVAVGLAALREATGETEPADDDVVPVEGVA